MHTRLDLATAGRKRRGFGDPAEAAEPGTALRAVCLLGVLVFAKIFTLAGREIPFSVWTLPALLWQELLLVLLFAALDRLVQRPRFAWMCYAAIVGYTALNVPIVRVLSTPLTWPMLRATSGTLSDSIAYHLTWLNVILLLMVIVAGVMLPTLCHRLDQQHLRVAGFAALPLIPLVAWAVTQVDTHGLHRNSLLTLVTTAVPRVSPQPAEEDWRLSPFPQPDGESLSFVVQPRNIMWF